jgi:hypothetical protein
MILKTDLKDCSIPDELVKSLRLDKNKELSLIRVCRKNDISFLGLFGSYSRGEQKEKTEKSISSYLVDKIKAGVKPLYHEES